MIFGAIGLPKRKFTGEDYFRYRDKINIGTVLLTKTNFELSNLINPTELKHAAIYVGNVFNTDIKYVFESTAKGAVLTDLVTFLLSKDRVVACQFKGMTDIFKRELPHTVLRFKGIPYDYLFTQGGKAFYCFELVAECFRDIYPYTEFSCREIVKKKKIYDHNTFLDASMFNIIFDSSAVN